MALGGSFGKLPFIYATFIVYIPLSTRMRDNRLWSCCFSAVALVPKGLESLDGVLR